jgi:hypothetical protein
LQGIANGAGFPAVHSVPAHPYFYVVEVTLSFEHPLVAVVHGAIILGDHFKLVVWIIALADALDGLLDRLPLVETRHEDAHGGLISVVFFDDCFRNRPLKNECERVLDD